MNRIAFQSAAIALAFLTPFFFLRGGLNVSLGALAGSLGVLALLFAGIAR